MSNNTTCQQTFVLMKTSWRRLETSFVFVFKSILINHTSSEDVFKASCSRPIYSSCPYVFKTSSRRFQDVFKTSSRRFQDVFKTSCKNVFKTSSRRLQDVFKTSSRRLANTSWRHLQDVLKTYHQVKLFLLTSLSELFNMFVRRTAKTVVYRRIHLGHASEKFMVSVKNLQGW